MLGKILFIVAAVIMLAGCSQKIEDIKNPEMVGEQVKVTGVAENTLKIGSLTSFKLVQGNQSIRVSSNLLPEEGSTVVVQGVLIRDTIFGYYIEADKVR